MPGFLLDPAGRCQPRGALPFPLSPSHQRLPAGARLSVPARNGRYPRGRRRKYDFVALLSQKPVAAMSVIWGGERNNFVSVVFHELVGSCH